MAVSRPYARIREFAGEVSQSGPDDLLVVVHLAIYTIDDDGAHLISAGAVWLDEPVEDQDEAIERLSDPSSTTSTPCDLRSGVI